MKEAWKTTLLVVGAKNKWLNNSERVIELIQKVVFINKNPISSYNAKTKDTQKLIEKEYYKSINQYYKIDNVEDCLFLKLRTYIYLQKKQVSLI